MRTVSKPFADLTAGDLMTTTVFSIPEKMSLQGAAHLLAGAGISGAPVVDAEGRCVGVLSSTDFVALADKGKSAPRQVGQGCACAFSAWQVMDTKALPEDEVARHMTVDPMTAVPSMPIQHLARMMAEAHIHRLIVVDQQRRPVGIVSSTDILAAVAYADLKSVEKETPW